MGAQGQPEAATWTLAAATAKKDVKRTKILKKGSKTKKDPKEEKPEKVPALAEVHALGSYGGLNEDRELVSTNFDRRCPVWGNSRFFIR